MTLPELSELLNHLHYLLSRGVFDVEARDSADAEFRSRYRELAYSEHLGRDVKEELREALLALVGDDDWVGACRHLDSARRLIAEG